MNRDSAVSFFTPEEIALSDDFLRNGFVVCDAEASKILEGIHQDVTQIAINWLKQSQLESKAFELSNSHNFVTNERLNDLRLTIFTEVNKITDIRQRYFRLARQATRHSKWCYGCHSQMRQSQIQCFFCRQMKVAKHDRESQQANSNQWIK